MRLRELFEHKKGVRATKYNKKPKKFIEPIKAKKAEAPHTTEDLEEGWKDWVAGAALGAASLGASAGNVAYQPVEKGDTVYSIARQNGVSPQEIMKLNHFNKDTKLVKGQKVKVPDNAKEVPVAKKVDKKPEVKKIEPKVTAMSSNAHEDLVIKVATAAGIKGTELAQFMAQLKHESADFAHMKEIGGSLDFKKYDPKFAPKTAKILGNNKIGDGARYKGRGFIQITGRDNYRMAGDALGLPLEAKPELAAKPDVAAKIAVWYWKTRVKPSVSNFDDTAAVTKKINPALRGLADRLSHFKDYKNILNIKA